MAVDVLLKGIATGVAVAAPVGPVALLCARKTLSGGIRAGFIAGLGAAAADALYGSILAFGLVAVSNFFVSNQAWIYPVGGLIICLVGFKALRHDGREQAQEVSSPKNTLASIGATFILTLSNPATLFALFVVGAALGLRSATGGVISSVSIVIGVFIGSALWWLLLTSGIRLFLSRLPARSLLTANRIQGVLLVAFGLFVVLNGILGGSDSSSLQP